MGHPTFDSGFVGFAHVEHGSNRPQRPMIVCSSTHLTGRPTINLGSEGFAPKRSAMPESAEQVGSSVLAKRYFREPTILFGSTP